MVEWHIVVEQFADNQCEFVVQQYDGLFERRMDIDRIKSEFRFFVSVVIQFVIHAIEYDYGVGRYNDGHGVLRLDVIGQQFKHNQQHQFQLFIEFHGLVHDNHVDDNVEQLGDKCAGLQWRFNERDDSLLQQRQQWWRRWRRRWHDNDNLEQSVRLDFWWRWNSDNIRRNVHHSCKYRRSRSISANTDASNRSE